jgi:RNA polymerase sigma-70 factor (ECF subfamily)
MRNVLVLMASDTVTDDQLIAAIQARDMQALEEFFDRYRVLSYSVAYRLLGNAADAEDVVQEAFVNVWRAAGTFRPGRGGGRAWLMSIVHHRAIDRLRGRGSRPVTTHLDDALPIADTADVWTEVSQRLTGTEVRRALDALPSEQRESIELAYFGGLSQSEIAGRLNVPLGTVKGRMRLGLKRLRSLLEASAPEMEPH